MNSSGRYREINPGGLSHSEIHGSEPACGYPWLIATCYVLHRLLAPRHSPFALSSLITKLTIYPARAGSMETQRIVICPSYLCLCVVVKEQFENDPSKVLPLNASSREKTLIKRQLKPRKNPIQQTILVGGTGLEPVTLRLSSACSNQLSYTPNRTLISTCPETWPRIGGAEESRTPDL